MYLQRNSISLWQSDVQPGRWGLQCYNVHPPPTAAKFRQRLQGPVTPVNMIHIMYYEKEHNTKTCKNVKLTFPLLLCSLIFNSIVQNLIK